MLNNTVFFRFLSDKVIFTIPNDNVLFRVLCSVLGDNGIFNVFNERIPFRVVIDRIIFCVLNVGSSLASDSDLPRILIPFDPGLLGFS